MNNVAKWLIIIIIGMLLLAMFSCRSALDTVTSNPKLLDQAVAEYVKKNPQKNDTTYIKGETIVKDSLIIDSIPLPVPVPYKIVERHFRETSQVDTSKIMDRKFVEALANRLTALEAKVKEVEKERDDWKHAAQLRLYWLIGLISLIIGGGVFWVFRTFQPKITLMK